MQLVAPRRQAQPSCAESHQRRTTARVQRQAPVLARGRPTRPQTLLETPPASPHTQRGLRRPGGHSEGPNTRSHPELGRENPLRPWYCRSSGGRVGRRQARQAHPTLSSSSLARKGEEFGPAVAGWSSPVARQAHNLKVVGSNPTPATIEVDPISATTGRLSRRALPVVRRECGPFVFTFPCGSARVSPRTRSTADPPAAAKAF